ncbi:MAG: phosphate signaling complex protein PhoU [Actinomycetota bacterium]
MGNPSSPQPLRASFGQELEQLRLQVEMMALKVDDALQRSATVLLTGDRRLAEEVRAGDDLIDDMFVSLTERCYDLLCRQSPVASDLRLVVSVLRILGDLERTGDLCLRIVKLVGDQPLLASHPQTFDILEAMADEARALFTSALTAWVSQDLRLATTLEERDDALDAHYSLLMAEVLALDGPDAVPLAVQTLSAGRALERIADHSVMIGERLRYMLTGSLRSISKEIGP